MAKEQYTIDVFRECIGQYKDKDIVEQFWWYTFDDFQLMQLYFF